MSFPTLYLGGLRWPLVLAVVTVALAFLAQPATGDLEAALVATALVSRITASGLFALPRLSPRPLALEQAIAGVVGCGLALALIPAFFAALSNLSFVLATPLFLVPYVALLPRRPLDLWWDEDFAELRRAALRLLPLLLLALAFGVLLVVLASLSPRHLDGWAASALMRAYRDDLSFDSPGTFRLDDSAWPAMLAYTAWTFPIDTLALYRTVLPPLSVLAGMLALWGLASAVLRDRLLALFALVAYQVLLLTSISAFGFQPGWQVLFSAAEDKTVAAFVLMPVAAMFLVRRLDVDPGSVTAWLPFAVLDLAVGVTHPLVGLLLAMVTGALMVIRLLARASSWREAAAPLVICAVALLPALLVFEDVTSKTEGLLAPGGEFFEGNRQSLELLGAINLLGDGWAVVGFRTIRQPLLLAGGALALTVPLAVAWAGIGGARALLPRETGHQYILAAVLVVIVAAFNPLAVRALTYLITTQLTWRITWLLPAALGLAAALGLGLRYLRPPMLVTSGGAAAVAVATFAFAMIGPWTNEAADNLTVDDAPERVFWEGPEGVDEVAAALRELGDEGDVVLAPPQYNFVLPSYTSYPEVVYRGLGRVAPSPDLEDQYARYQEIVAFYGAESVESLRELREKYGVDYVLLAAPPVGQVSPPCSGDPATLVDGVAIYRVHDDGC